MSCYKYKAKNNRPVKIGIEIPPTRLKVLQIFPREKSDLHKNLSNNQKLLGLPGAGSPSCITKVNAGIGSA